MFIAGGQRLVLGTQAQPLTVQVDPADATRSALGLADSGIVRLLDPQELGGGSIAGLLRFQNDDLVDARTQLGQLAAALAGKVNEQQALGLDMSDPPGSGVPIFAAGPAVALPDAGNAVNGAGQFIGRVSLSVTDASQLRASEYALRADPGGAAGVWELTRLDDGLVRSIGSGDVLDGMRIDIGPPAPAATDRFLLQPVTRAADGMRRVLDNVRGLAAASPLSASTPAPTPAPPAWPRCGSSAPRPTRSRRRPSASPTTAATIAGSCATASATRCSPAASARWAAGTPIAINGFELELNGVPRSGDAFSVGKTPYPASNNGNALAFAALRDAALVGRGPLAAGGMGGGSSITDAYAAAMANIGVRVQGAQSSADISGAVATQAEAQRSAKSGVNLDEEAARLIQYQQSYQAAAKVLQIAQSIFDTLLDAAR